MIARTRRLGGLGVVLGVRLATASLDPAPPAVNGLVVDADGRPAAAARPAPRARRIVMKMREGITTCVACALGHGARLGPLAPGSRLDGVLAANGIRSARALLRYARPVTPGNPRFAARARRAPGAAPPAFDRTWVLDVPGRADLGAVARQLAADPAVEWAEPDRVARVALVPDDPFFTSSGSWGQPFGDLWGLQRIGAATAWDTTRGGGVLVAIVDTGIDRTHPDIAANVWTNPGEVPGNAIDDDGNGFVDDVYGWDFADDDGDPHDDNLHGTHVAGTVAAVGDNGAGIVGVAYESRVMAVRGLGSAGFGFSSDLAEAILYAVDNGADVINASWGGSGQSQVITDAIAAAHAAGVVFVAAAGNDGADTSTFFPAADPNAITVGAFTHADTRAAFSNFGLKLDVGAPGGGDDPPPSKNSIWSILSLRASGLAPGNDPESALELQSGGAVYLRLAGTSMASPHVAGAAALVLAAHPTYTVEQVRQAIRSTADDLAPPGRDDESGYGIVDVAGAVAAAPPLEAHLSSPAGAILVGPDDVDVRGDAQGPGFTSYSVDYRPAGDPSGWVTIAGPVATPVAGGVLATWAAASLAEGTYVLRLEVRRGAEVFRDEAGVEIRHAEIESPESLAALRPDGPIEIRGTAAGGGFVGYTVEIRRPALHGTSWVTDGVTLAAPPATPVRHGLLATLDASALTEGDRFDFRLLVTNAQGTREVLRRGVVIDPTLRPGWPQLILPGVDREYLTVADIDGDGTQEILAGSADEVVVFRHDGTVAPGWPQSVVVDDPLVVTHGSPLVADVLGDAAPEVIASNGRHLLVWSGDGVLQAPFPIVATALANSGNEWISAGDVDGDGKDDIICASGWGLSVYRGNGTLLPGWSLPEAYSRMAAVADALAGGGAEVAWWHARKDPLSGRGIVSLFQNPAIELAARSAKGTTFTRTLLGDMDGDGRLDMVVAARKPNSVGTKLKVSAATADGRKLPLRKPRIAGKQRAPGRFLALADLDRDGQAEAWQYARIAPTGNFDDETGLYAPWQWKKNPTPHVPVLHRLIQNSLFRDGPYPFAIAIGDIDGDGVQELVGGHVGNGCGHLLDTCVTNSAPGAPIRRALPVQRPDGTFPAAFPKPVPQYFNDNGEPTGIGVSAFLDDPSAPTPAIADLDGDGLKEVIWWDPESSRIFVWNVAGTPGPLLADWPMYAHDAKHSNALPPTVP